MATKKEVIAAIKGFSASEKKEIKEALGISGDSSDFSGLDEKALEQQKEYNKVLKETAQSLGNVLDARKAEYGELEATLRLATDENNKRIFTEQQIADIRAGQMNSYTDEQVHLKAIADQYRDIHLLKEADKQYGEDQRKLLGDIAGGLGVNMKFSESFLGTVIKVGDAFKDTSEVGLKQRELLIDNFKQMFSFGNLAYSIFTKVAEASAGLLVSFDNARASLASATGAGYKFADSMFDAQREMNLLGITMDEAGAATATLAENTSMFAKMSNAARSEMIKTTAALGKIGVDAATAAETFQFLNLNLGMTSEEALGVQESLAMMGTSIGISSAKITKDFNAALPTLAVYGKQSVEVFSNLAAAAKSAGVETSALLGIAKQFDTFAGAAEGVGKLNALLGTQLSTTQMLMMTEDERIETLIEQVQAQGVAFKDMDRFTQKAIAAAAGIDDMNEAQKIFGMNLGDYKKNQEEMARNAEAQGKFEDAIRKTVPVMNQFKLLATEIVASVQPMLEVLGSLAAKLTKTLQEMNPETKEFIGNLVLGATGAFMLFKAVKPLLTIFGVLGGAGGAAAGAGGAVGAAASISAFSGALWAALPAIGAVALALGGLYLLYKAATAIGDSFGGSTAASTEETVALAAASEKVLTNLTKIGESDFSAAIAGMNALIMKANEFDNLSPKVTATIENLALINVGKATSSITGGVITASGGNITANVKNVFSNMKVVVDIGGEQFNAKVRTIAADEANK